MTPTNIALDLENCRKLKDAGIEIETYYMWAFDYDIKDGYSLHGKNILKNQIEDNDIPAPTLEELLEYWRKIPGYTELRMSSEDEFAYKIDFGCPTGTYSRDPKAELVKHILDLKQQEAAK